MFVNARFRPTTLVIPAGISLFGMLFAVAQGVERLLEPVSSFFFSTKRHSQQRNANVACAVNLVRVDRQTVLQDGDELALLPPVRCLSAISSPHFRHFCV